MKKTKRNRAVQRLGLLMLCAALCTGCAEKTAAPEIPMDASAISFEPTVYHARGGRIRFLYDSETDMLTAYEGHDMAALYTGGVYSLVISYEKGTVERKEADDRIRQEFANGFMTLSEKTEKVRIDRNSFRQAEIECTDGSEGAVCYGNTETGFAKIYYIISPDAAEDAQQHIDEILSTVRFSEYGLDEIDPEYTNIYYQP